VEVESQSCRPKEKKGRGFARSSQGLKHKEAAGFPWLFGKKKKRKKSRPMFCHPACDQGRDRGERSQPCFSTSSIKREKEVTTTTIHSCLLGKPERKWSNIPFPPQRRLDSFRQSHPCGGRRSRAFSHGPIRHAFPRRGGGEKASRNFLPRGRVGKGGIILPITRERKETRSCPQRQVSASLLWGPGGE